MKILDVNNLLEAGSQIIPEAEFNGYVTTLTEAARALADSIAFHSGVIHHDTSHEPGFGGLCASFTRGNSTPLSRHCMGDLDPSGEWDE